jgi:NTE family protein
MDEAVKEKRIGLALSGGSARGLAHIGVLDVLEKNNIKIDAIAGTSMGAVIGALYSSGVSLGQMFEFIDSMTWKRFSIFSNFNTPGLPVINSKKVSVLLDKFLEDKTFDDCDKKFCCVAVDVLSKQKVVLKDGMLKRAVEASIAIPGIFEPVRTGNMVLIDGGVIEPLPTDAIRLMDVDFVIASSLDNIVVKDCGTNPKIFELLENSLVLMEREISKNYIKKADVLITPKTGDYTLFDFLKAKDIIERGRIAAQEKIGEIIEKLANLNSPIQVRNQ